MALAGRFCNAFRSINLRRIKPLTQISRTYSSMDDDGDLANMRTTVTILNQEQNAGIFIDAYSQEGFRLNSGIRVLGPCAVFPKSILHWNVSGIDDVNENSLSLFTILEPKLDILVLGVGERDNLSRINPSIIKYLRSKKLNVEILSTDQALSTFNFLNSEKRYVAGAFIPPSYVHMTDDDFSPQTSITDDPYSKHGDFIKDQVEGEGMFDDVIKDKRPLAEKLQERLHGKKPHKDGDS